MWDCTSMIRHIVITVWTSMQILTAGWQTFTTEFTTKGFTGTVNDGRLLFWFASFAAAGDIYYIDNVRLEKV